jgi:ABC-type nitrate/sulfonate/bicarbonate transport system substrate-binding protein
MLKQIVTAAALLLAVAAASAQAPKPLEVNVFPGGDNWPIWVAEDKGFFARNGVAVKTTNTPNSVAQITGVLEGKFDIAMTALDNVVAYQEGQGEVPLSSPPDLFAFMGAISGTLRLLAQPDIKTYAGMKGKTLGVDAANTGYALVAYKLLAMNGIAAADYKIERSGGTLARVNLMMQGKIASTAVTTPLDIVPLAKGYTMLGDTTRDIGPYQRIIGAARRSWAAQNSDRLIPYIRAYVAAIDWLRQNANREEAVDIYVKHTPNASREVAAKAYDSVVNPREGLQSHARLDPAGVRTVLRIRSELGTPPKDLNDAAKYLDESYYDKAMK